VSATSEHIMSIAPSPATSPRPLDPPPAPPTSVTPSPWPDEVYRGWSGL